MGSQVTYTDLVVASFLETILLRNGRPGSNSGTAVDGKYSKDIALDGPECTKHGDCSAKRRIC
jgi:hypothetical protein